MMIIIIIIVVVVAAAAVAVNDFSEIYCIVDEAIATNLLFRQISVILQRFNVILLHGSLPVRTAFYVYRRNTDTVHFPFNHLKLHQDYI